MSEGVLREVRDRLFSRLEREDMPEWERRIYARHLREVVFDIELFLSEFGLERAER